ncbi:hypothetical protein GGQ84_002129 [Desulfitispora alkaliphila]|uniref:DNA-binding protein WhiA n=1 Tax=Desulfitispora alkaliphila TaxID=622674 RepID=UPI003D1CD768
MSFSIKTKNELARITPENVCCQLAELGAMIRMDGTIKISPGKGLSLQVVTESAPAARKVFKLLKELFQVPGEIIVQRKNRLKKNNVYVVNIPSQPEVKNILDKLGIMDANYNINPEIRKDLIDSECCQRTYLRGVFLGGGSVNNPEGTYHLEIITADQIHGLQISNLINNFDLNAKLVSRKKWWVVYIKGSEQIAGFLSLIGAHTAMLDFENVKVYKDMRNKVNRLVNCETANLTKTVDAALRQVECINSISRTIGLDKLSPGLQQIAKLRLEYPDTSLKELGEMCEPPVSKSGVNHRMRKIEKMAEDFKKRK